MKWFKHESKARNDERLSKLEDKADLEGYGFYFKMLEIVAENMDSSDKCEMTYSLSRWGRQINVTSKKFIFLSQCCHDVGLMFVQRVGDDITVKIPNLLKYRDNHTKNLQATYKQELDKELKVEVELELDKTTTLSADKSATKKTAKPKQEETALQAVCKDTWAKYSHAYFTRYGTNPVRNEKVNSNVKGFVQRIGFEEAPLIASWYVNNNNRFYVGDMHGFGLLLKDAEKLRTEWATGRTMTSTRANQIDKTESNRSAVAEAMELLGAQS
jgi:hypothetical protein